MNTMDSNISNIKSLDSKIGVYHNNLLVRELAKTAAEYGVIIGEKRLWNTLRKWGLIFKNSTEPKQIGIEKGYFSIVSGETSTNYGLVTYHTTKVTPVGQFYILSRLISEEYK